MLQVNAYQFNITEATEDHSKLFPQTTALDLIFLDLIQFLATKCYFLLLSTFLLFQDKDTYFLAMSCPNLITSVEFSNWCMKLIHACMFNHLKSSKKSRAKISTRFNISSSVRAIVSLITVGTYSYHSKLILFLF